MPNEIIWNIGSYDLVIFNPLANSYPAGQLRDLPRTTEFWVDGQDLHILRLCERMYVLRLPGWEESSGVNAELSETADLCMEQNWLYPEEWVTDQTMVELRLAMAGQSAANCLAEANEIIYGERQDQYGNPEDSFGLIADLWSVYLSHKLSGNLTRRDAALMMVLFKLARERHQHKRDNLVDAAGYIGIAADRTGEWEGAADAA